MTGNVTHLSTKLNVVIQTSLLALALGGSTGCTNVNTSPVDAGSATHLDAGREDAGGEEESRSDAGEIVDAGLRCPAKYEYQSTIETKVNEHCEEHACEAVEKVRWDALMEFYASNSRCNTDDDCFMLDATGYCSSGNYISPCTTAFSKKARCQAIAAFDAYVESICGNCATNLCPQDFGGQGGTTCPPYTHAECQDGRCRGVW